MKPKRLTTVDYDRMSDEELDALVDEVLTVREARIKREARKREATEYGVKIYDAIYEAQYNGFTVRINDEIVDNNFDVEVES